MSWVLARLAERSTWLGIISMLTGAGVVISPDLANVVIGAGTGIAGLIGFVTSDKK